MFMACSLGLFGAQQHFETNVVLADKKERIYYVLK